MIPEWMTTEDSYVPPRGGGTFALRTIKTISDVIGRLRFQSGHEKRYALPALLKLILLVLFIFILSVNRNYLVLLFSTAVFLLYLCTWPPKDILPVLGGAFAPGLLTAILLIPAMIMNPGGRFNQMMIVWKVFLSAGMVGIFNHTTQWNHITAALRKIHIPGIFIFTIDITLKYIVILGRFIRDVLTAYILRAVGNHKGKSGTVGGVMGVTFLRGTEMSREMYEAMRCRGFTDDYRGI